MTKHEIAKALVADIASLRPGETLMIEALEKKKRDDPVFRISRTAPIEFVMEPT